MRVPSVQCGVMRFGVLATLLAANMFSGYRGVDSLDIILKQRGCLGERLTSTNSGSSDAPSRLSLIHGAKLEMPTALGPGNENIRRSRLLSKNSGGTNPALVRPSTSGRLRHASSSIGCTCRSPAVATARPCDCVQSKSLRHHPRSLRRNSG